MANNKRVLFSNGMYSTCLLIETNAPKEAIEQWCKAYSEALENMNKIGLETLSNYYVEVIIDSDLEDISEEEVRAMGYDEEYDLCQY